MAVTATSRDTTNENNFTAQYQEVKRHMPSGDAILRAKLEKLENLFSRAGTSGERDAAGAAIDRVKDRLKSERTEQEIELKLSLPDA